MTDRQVAYPTQNGPVVTVSQGWLRDPQSASGTYDEDWHLEVTFERPDATDPGGITAVTMTSQRADIRAGMLSRFAWAQWLRVAEATIRNPGPDTPPMTLGEGDIFDQMRQWEEAHTAARAKIQAAVKRALKRTPHPGRAGRPDSFYEHVGELYTALLRDGHPDPTERLALQLGVSRNTISGWLRRARDRALLPEARPGRAG